MSLPKQELLVHVNCSCNNIMYIRTCIFIYIYKYMNQVRDGNQSFPTQDYFSYLTPSKIDDSLLFFNLG